MSFGKTFRVNKITCVTVLLFSTSGRRLMCVPFDVSLGGVFQSCPTYMAFFGVGSEAFDPGPLEGGPHAGKAAVETTAAKRVERRTVNLQCILNDSYYVV